MKRLSLLIGALIVIGCGGGGIAPSFGGGGSRVTELKSLNATLDAADVKALSADGSVVAGGSWTNGTSGAIVPCLWVDGAPSQASTPAGSSAEGRLWAVSQNGSRYTGKVTGSDRVFYFDGTTSSLMPELSAFTRPRWISADGGTVGGTVDDPAGDKPFYWVPGSNPVVMSGIAASGFDGEEFFGSIGGKPAGKTIGGAVTMLDMPDGAEDGYIADKSASGIYVGTVQKSGADHYSQAGYWANGQFRGLPFPNQSDRNTRSISVSADGTVIFGEGVFGDGQQTAFYWNGAVGLTDLRNIAPSPYDQALRLTPVGMDKTGKVFLVVAWLSATDSTPIVITRE